MKLIKRIICLFKRHDLEFKGLWRRPDLWINQCKRCGVKDWWLGEYHYKKLKTFNSVEELFEDLHDGKPEPNPDDKFGVS